MGLTHYGPVTKNRALSAAKRISSYWAMGDSKIATESIDFVAIGGILQSQAQQKVQVRE